MNKVLIIDNYDSFTYNVFQSVCTLGFESIVKRHDELTISEIREINPSHIIIGPGPNSPKDYPNCISFIKEFKNEYPILGICLGHECILYAFGVPIVNAKNILHGKQSIINHSQDSIFSNVPQDIKVARYHSLVGKREEIPSEFEIIAFNKDDEVMAFRHKKFELIGVQFHPESIGSEFGLKILMNFINHKRLKIPIKSYLHKLTQLQNLSFNEAYDLMECIAQNDLTQAQIGSLITSFAIKKPISEELSAFASLLRMRALKFEPKVDSEIVDIVGTGGSSKKTFNVSTTVALILASMGIKIAKHGNRAITSNSGSADLLSELGININMDLNASKRCFDELGITFLFAPNIHNALKYVQTARKELGFKSIFNLLGPLSNPLNPSFQLVGIFSPEYTDLMANAFRILGTKKALVVSGLEGLDEISICGSTQISELNNGIVKTYEFNPSKFLDLKQHSLLRGGDSKINAQITLDILKGIPSPKLDLVALNAGAALYVCNKSNSIEEGFHIIKEFLKTKKTLTLLDNFKKLSFS